MPATKTLPPTSKSPCAEPPRDRWYGAPPMPRLQDLPQRLAELAAQDLLREPDDGLAREELRRRFGDRFIDLTSNDYLGLAAAHVSRETLDSVPGAGASRLIYGTRREHLELEAELAAWVRQPASLFFASAYAANVGALGCLAGPGDWVVSDELNHASLIDGCRLSRAEVRVVAHRDTTAVERALLEGAHARARWVVVESYYSMDGDSPDLRALRELCDRYDAHLYVDEAHGLGVFGPEGGGLCTQEGIQADVLVGGLGKACGAQGGFVAADTSVRTWLWNRARSFVFSTAPSPLLAAAALAQIRRTREAQALRRNLFARAEELRQALRDRNIPLAPEGHGPILAVLLGAPDLALSVAAALRDEGILAQAIRPPTVPVGASRLRLTVTANHRPEDLARAVDALTRALEGRLSPPHPESSERS